MFAVYRSFSPLLRCTLNSSKALPLEPTAACINGSQIFPQHDYACQQEKISTNCMLRQRNFHTSLMRKDMETAVKGIGAGLAAIGIGTPGIGLGYAMGSLCNATARNPSLKNQLFVFGIMGAAFCEALGLFAFVVSLMILFA